MSLQEEFWIKNMVCSRCLKVIAQELQELGVSVLSLELGRLLVKAPTKTKIEIVDAVTTVLHTNNFEIVRNEEEMLVERIKIILIEQDRKSTRLNSSHVSISYAVFCLKKKKKK